MPPTPGVSHSIDMWAACENKSLTLEQMNFDFGRHLGLLGGTCCAHAQSKLRRSQSREFILNGRACIARLSLLVCLFVWWLAVWERQRGAEARHQIQKQSAWRENYTPFLPTFNLMFISGPAIDVEIYEWTGSIFISPAQIPASIYKYLLFFFFSFYFWIFHMFMFIMLLNLYSKFYLLLSLLVLKNKAGP